MGRTSDAHGRLIASARHLVGRRGYHQVGINELCRHAGVNKGSFYHFFPSKESLALDMLDSFWSDYEARMKDSLGGGGSPLERLDRFLRETYLRHRGLAEIDGCVSGCLLGNLALELATATEAVRERLVLSFERLAAAVAVVIAEAMEAGEVPSGDPQQKGEEFLAYFEGAILLAKVRNDPEVIRRLRGGIFTLLGAASKEENTRTGLGDPEPLT